MLLGPFCFARTFAQHVCRSRLAAQAPRQLRLVAGSHQFALRDDEPIQGVQVQLLSHVVTGEGAQLPTGEVSCLLVGVQPLILDNPCGQPRPAASGGRYPSAICILPFSGLALFPSAVLIGSQPVVNR